MDSLASEPQTSPSHSASKPNPLGSELRNYEEKALAYHAAYPRGKIATVLSKPLDTQEDLSLAYSPGVAGPCRLIAQDPEAAYLYTGKGNLVAVISNGTAVLGLGAIGAAASKPVMEGKAMLFKKFAGIDAIDLEINEEDPEQLIRIIASLEPSFGGINLEDIKAPECFIIEEQLKEKLQIPVFHDDQHGTAIIASAALLNALAITGKSLETIKVVFSGSGAAAIATADMFVNLGLPKQNILLCDSRGILHKERFDLNRYKERYAQDTKLRRLEEALVGADVFVGLSAAGLMSPAMLLSMAPQPIVFALANPDPEITPDLALATRGDVIIATGRSDYPNQVNNVLGFPYLFRGALDVRARHINEEMKLAAAQAIAALASLPVPAEVQKTFAHEGELSFGPRYLIPKPNDPRVLPLVASAVAAAAMASGVARLNIDLDAYRQHLSAELDASSSLQ